MVVIASSCATKFGMKLSPAYGVDGIMVPTKRLKNCAQGNCMARVIAMGLAYKASSGSVKIQIRSIPFLFPFRLRFRLNSSKIPSKLV